LSLAKKIGAIVGKKPLAVRYHSARMLLEFQIKRPLNSDEAQRLKKAIKGWNPERGKI
jgi:hypothetical protein